MINAALKTDNGVHEVTFDATPWFEQADVEALRDLAKCDFGGDYPADDVAWWVGDHDETVREVLDYCQEEDEGFEVHIDKEQALAWLKEHREGLALSPKTFLVTVAETRAYRTVYRVEADDAEQARRAFDEGRREEDSDEFVETLEMEVLEIRQEGA
jgi:hypothetical protein